jgi:HK97 family phage portal protein
MQIIPKIKKLFSRKRISLSSNSVIGNINQLPTEMWNEFYAAFPNVSYQAVLGYAPSRHAIEIISGMCGKLTCNQYARTKRGREKVNDGMGYWCLNREPNPWMRPSVFKRQFFAYYCVFGQAAAQIKRDEWTAESTELRIIDPQSWITRYDPSTGNPIYEVLTGNGWQAMNPADLLIIRDLGDTIRGYSLVTIAHESLQHSLNLQKFASKFFVNGRAGSEWIELPAGFTDESKRIALIKKIRETYAGVENAWKQFFVPAGTKVTPNNFDAENSQMLASQQHDLVNIANLFGIPPSYLGANINTSFKSLEEESRTLLKALDPMLVQFEEECSRKLQKESDFQLNRKYFEMARNELIEIDTPVQKQIAREQWLAGQINFKEMREMDNRTTDAEGLWCMPANIRIMDGLAPPPPPAPIPASPSVDNADTTNTDMPMESTMEDKAVQLSRGILSKIKTRLAKSSANLQTHKEVILSQLNAWENKNVWWDDFSSRIEEEYNAVLSEQRQEVLDKIDIEKELEILCK